MKTRISILLGLGVSLSFGAEIPKEEMPTTFYTQKVVVKGFDAEDPIEILPLYKGLAWAVMTRWDDDPGIIAQSDTADMTMSRLLDKYGYKGSFFLNSRGLGTEMERSLLGRGHSLGSHSNSHPVLPDCNYNRMFEELLGSRIAMESRTDVPVNSFSVPGNHFVVDSKPGIEWDIYRLLLRSGYVQMAWPGQPPAGMSELSWNDELPGDCDDPAALLAAFSKIVNDKEIQQKEPNVSFSTHAWHYADKWPVMEELLKPHARNKNYWYCTQAEYGAYRYQYRHAKIQNLVRQNGQLSFDLVRPSIIDAGLAVPLSIKIPGQGSNPEISGDGQKLSPDEIDSAFLIFSIPSPAQDQPPKTIDAVTVEGAPVTPRKFPSLKANLSLDIPQKTLSLELANTGPELSYIIATYRLAPVASPGILRKEFPNLPKGQPLKDIVPLQWVSRSAKFLEGQSLFTVQLDFTQGNQRQRLFIIRTNDLGSLKE